jgi:hypothetical protein
MNMKYFFIATLVVASFGAKAQSTSIIPPFDQSPMDMVYFPDNYPILKIQNKVSGPLEMRVIYSRPQVKDRKIFGGLQEFGKVWRVGANEATEIEFFKNVTINNKKIMKGRYTLYAIPYADKWTFILNKVTDTWGAFKYDSSKDVVRITVPILNNSKVEDMTISLDKTNTGADLCVLWDEVKAVLPINF